MSKIIKKRPTKINKKPSEGIRKYFHSLALENNPEIVKDLSSDSIIRNFGNTSNQSAGNTTRIESCIPTENYVQLSSANETDVALVESSCQNKICLEVVRMHVILTALFSIWIIHKNVYHTANFFF